MLTANLAKIKGEIFLAFREGLREKSSDLDDAVHRKDAPIRRYALSCCVRALCRFGRMGWDGMG